MNRWKAISLLMVGVFLMVSAPVKANAACSLTATPNGSTVTLNATGCEDTSHYMRILNKDNIIVRPPATVEVKNGVANRVFTSLSTGEYTAHISQGSTNIKAEAIFSITEEIVAALKCGDKCEENATNCPSNCKSTRGEGGQWYCGYVPPVPPVPPVPETKPNDLFCGKSSEGDNPKVYTALGCVPVRMGDFVTWLLPYLFGIAGGIAFLLMVYGFILMATSQGDPKVVQGAKETITSAITGLLISIFALFLLRLIAVNILHIPGIN